MPGCEALGEYRAPKSRRNLGDYWWFCLEHVRAYNSTWPLGRLGSTSAWDEELIRDPLHLLNAGRVKRGTSRTSEQTPPELREPLATLGLSWPTTLDAVKTRYN